MSQSGDQCVLHRLQQPVTIVCETPTARSITSWPICSQQVCKTSFRRTKSQMRRWW